MLNRDVENTDWLFEPDKEMRKFYQFLQDFRNGQNFRQAFSGVVNVVRHCCKFLGASIRTLTISTLSYPDGWGEYYHVPWIRLHGRWLEHSGFKTGQKIKVVALKDIIFILPDQPDINMGYLQDVDWANLQHLPPNKEAA